MPQIPIKWVTDKRKNKVYAMAHINSVRDDDGNPLSQYLGGKALGYGTCSTAAATAAKAVTIANYAFSTDSTIVVVFTNGISVASATLAVTYDGEEGQETTSAIPIYYRGAALGADMVKAGDSVMLHYNGTQLDVIGDLYPEVEARFVDNKLVFTKGGEFVNNVLVLD